MKRITTSIAAAISLTFLSLAIPTVASAQTAQAVRTAHIHSTSDAPSNYVRYCVSAIEDAVRDATVDRVLDKVLHLPNAAKAYDIYTTGSDEAQLKYELNHKQYLSAPFSASRVLYDFLRGSSQIRARSGRSARLPPRAWRQRSPGTCKQEPRSGRSYGKTWRNTCRRCCQRPQLASASARTQATEPCCC